jgi:hypothetical protein
MQFRAILVANFVLASVLSASAVAQAASDAAAAVSQPSSAASPSGENPDRIVCHFEQETGSKIPKRLCKTAAAWELDRERSLKLIQDAQQRTGSTRSR